MKVIKLPLAMMSAVAVAALLNGCMVITPDIRAISLDIQGGHHSRVKIVLGSDDRGLIHHYYAERHQSKGKKRHGRPPGLAKKQRLPPGLQRQLEKNGQLPPGLQGHRLPADLERKLTPLPAGYVRLLVGSEVVIINKQSRVIVDLMMTMRL